MQRIIIDVECEEKANLLLALLKSVDFIDDIQMESVAQAPAEDFFDLAGIWADRDIDQATLRRQAYRTSNLQAKWVMP